MRTALLGCPCIAVLLLGASGTGAEPSGRGTLHLMGGDLVEGELKDVAQPQMLRWHAPGFVLPFTFPTSSVKAVHFAVPDEHPQPAGDACLELAGGDRLFGSLVGLTADHMEWDLPGCGPVRIRRESIRRLLGLRDASDLIYLGPNRLADWEHSGFQQDKGAHLSTNQRGAFLDGDLGIPLQAAVEFELSWSGSPDFVLAIGVGDAPESIEQAFRFEVWDENLVVMRETGDVADVALLRPIARAEGGVELQAYLDQAQDRIVVFSGEGKQLADLTVADGKSEALPRLRLVNRRGELRLKRLRVTRYRGQPPRDIRTAAPRVHRSDGSIIYGDVKSFDQEAQELVVTEGEREMRVGKENIRTVVFAPHSEHQSSALRFELHNGMRLSGRLIKVEHGQIWLRSSSLSEPLALPVAELRTIHASNAESPERIAEGKGGRIEWDGVKLHGRLVEGRGAADKHCLIWRPRAGTTASPLQSGVEGRIIYREQPPPIRGQGAERDDTRGRSKPSFLGTFVRALTGAEAQGKRRPSTSQQMLYLRSGDTIPCQVKRIAESGVVFETSLTDAAFVSHEKVKAIELAGVANTVTLSREKLKRLLTLPRIQRNNPPTHLIRSINGDFLRARLQRMDGTTLTVEVHLEARKLPRDSVAQIIWLHEDEWERAGQDPSPSRAAEKTPVQALRRDGIRLTFVPEQLSEGRLSGKSDVLGECHVEMEEVDQLLIGAEIEQEAARLKYGRWRLYPATDPQFVTADERQGDRPPGTESALVGKPAPDFELELLSGQRFRLAEQKGKVVVLDFWATWCGPCMQVMPQIDRVVDEFKKHDVQLVAVNLQEQPEKVTSTLERLKLTTTVALDIDGAVAAKYSATAIPQTVIIDADGNIVRLFVGGGRQFGQQLHDALESVLEDEDSEADPDPDAT